MSCGLDSLVIGENEITGQVKQTYRIACEQGTNGMLTNKLFHAAFRTAKQVKSETGINEGNCSVGSVAVDIAAEIFPDLQHCKVLVIGAGRIGRIVTRNFAKQEVKGLIIANRSIAKAVELAQEVGGTAISLDNIIEQVGNVDVIVSGTGSADYLLCSHDVQRALQRSPAKQLLMVDIALPRDIDPEIGSLPGVILKNLYDLKGIVERNLEKRKQEIPKAQKIVAEEVQKFLTWKDSLKINSTIRALAIHFETLRLQELEKYEHQFPKETLTQVDAFTRSLAKKYIHHIVSNIRSLHEVCELDAREIHILEHLFDSHEIRDKRTLCRVKREQTCPKSNSCRYKPPQNS
jgi:glutamyl-tRNA reductase